MQEAVASAFGAERYITQKRAAYGGDINESYTIILDDGTPAFLKTNSLSAADNFAAEAQGLLTIAGTGTIRVPEVLGHGTDPDGYSFLLLSYIGSGAKIQRYWETFARELAAMHRAGETVPAPTPAAPHTFGFDSDNYIGLRRQVNTPKKSWIDFFRECRLAPQFRDARQWFDEAERRQISYLLDHLDDILIEPAYPSLLHGDLWSGNFMTGEDGKAWLIDPAVYRGHFEADLAMTELFGGFSPAFYDAYREMNPIGPGYSDRREIYNLYQLLNHLNLFGGSYLGAVKQTLYRYGG